MSKRLEMLELMLSKGSTDPFHHYAHAMELRSVGRREDALAAFETLTTRFADYVPTYLMGAQVADELGRRDEDRAEEEQHRDEREAASTTRVANLGACLSRVPPHHRHRSLLSPPRIAHVVHDSGSARATHTCMVRN